jgi:hypothetical protein
MQGEMQFADIAAAGCAAIVLTMGSNENNHAQAL